MGRLPDQFAGRVITYREPFSMEGVKTITSGQNGQQYAPGVFTHASDKPFEVHRMIPRIFGLTSQNVLADCDDQCTLDYYLGLVKVRINDVGKTMEFQASSVYLASLVKGSSENTWEFAQPFYMAKGELLNISLDADTFPAGFTDVIASLRVHLTFEGFQLIVAPASDNR